MSDRIDSSDGEAPESVSFGSSRETALNVIKVAAELSKGTTTHKQRRAKEEKRKRRQERRDEKIENSESTNENLARLNNLREKAKEALADNPNPARENVSKVPVQQNSRKLFTQDVKEPIAAGTEESNDFIPFNNDKGPTKRTSRDIEISGTSKLRVEMVSSKKPKVLAAESVLNFRETMLYGAGSKVKRESSKSVIARREKMKLSGKNVFCTK